MLLRLVFTELTKNGRFSDLILVILESKILAEKLPNLESKIDRCMCTYNNVITRLLKI